MPRPKKSDSDADIKRTTISMPSDAFEQAKRNAKRRGFNNSFSAYVAWLIERDHDGDVKREDLHEKD